MPFAYQIDRFADFGGSGPPTMQCFPMSGQQTLKKLHVWSSPDIEKQGKDVQDLPESSVYTGLPVNRTIPTAAVWA